MNEYVHSNWGLDSGDCPVVSCVGPGPPSSSLLRSKCAAAERPSRVSVPGTWSPGSAS